MITVAIVGGFLGAGKTTWLTHHLQESGHTITAIVNDVASVGVDDVTLQTAIPPSPTSHPLRVRAITGGCLCCERLDELSAALIEAVDYSHSLDHEHHVVIETSGVASLEPILRLLVETPTLKRNAKLASRTVVVDGVGGITQLRHRLLAREQARLADRLIISKADLLNDEHVRETAGYLRAINPDADIATSIMGRETPMAFTAPHDIQLTFETDDLPLTTWVAELSANTSWAEYALWLDALIRAHPDRVVRSKGTICTEVGLLLVQSVGASVARPTVTQTGCSPATTQMIFITQNLTPEVLAESLSAFVPSASLCRSTAN